MDLNEILKGLTTTMMPDVPVSTEPQTVPLGSQDPADYAAPLVDPRVARLNKDFGAQGITASTQKDGSVYITNVKDAGGAGAKIVSSNPSAPTDAGTPSFNLFQQMGEISKIQDPTERFQALVNLRGSASAHLDSLKTTAAMQAGKQFDVPALEEQLAQSEAADKADPAYKLFLSDSKHTAQVRAQLSAARGNAEAEAAKLFDRNPEASTITDALNLFQQKEGLLYTQSLTKTASDGDKKQNVIDAVSPADRELYLGANPKIAVTFDPADTNQVYAISKQALYESQQPTFKQASAALASGNADSLTNLIATDNPFARAAVLKAQTEALAKGDPANASAKAEQQTNFLFNLTNSGAAFDNFVKTQMPAQYQNINKELQKATLGLAGKDLAAKQREVRATIAKDLLTQSVTQQFVGNVSATNWGPSYDALIKDPVLGPAYEELRTQAAQGNNNPQVSLTALIGSLKKDPTAISNLRAITSAAYSSTNTGIFGKADSLNLDSVFNQAVTKSLMQKLTTSNPEGFGYHLGG